MRKNKSSIFECSCVLSTRYLRTIYAQSILGFLWLFVRPSINLFTLLFVAAIASSNKIGSNSTFIETVLSGFIIYDIFSRIVQHTTTSSVYYKNIVRNVSMPIFAVPLSGLIVGIAESLPGLIVSFIYLNSKEDLGFTNIIQGIAFPILISGLCAFSLGLLLALVNIWMRDIKNSIGIVLQSFMYISPVAYLPSGIPNSINWINQYNPLCYLISTTRHRILGIESKYLIDSFTHPIVPIIAIISLLSFMFYRRTAKYIPEII